MADNYRVDVPRKSGGYNGGEISQFGGGLNVCFNLNILNFIYYVNNFPSLKNEGINRLKYYARLIFESDINIDNIVVVGLNEEDLKYVLSTFFYNIANDDNFYKRVLISVMTTMLSYNLVANFISKKNIFTKKVEDKISIMVKYFVRYFNKRMKTRESVLETKFRMDDLMGFIKSVLNDNFFKILQFRQTYRHKHKNFVEYDGVIGEFRIFPNLVGFIDRYKEIESGSGCYSYERRFFDECNDFTKKFYDVAIV
ncbi:MAG: hypothetical protein IJ853_01970 [Rickettsiales bacterium]|nr:hypothetical protein [Rickettsiales bacterium]